MIFKFLKAKGAKQAKEREDFSISGRIQLGIPSFAFKNYKRNFLISGALAFKDVLRGKKDTYG